MTGAISSQKETESRSNEDVGDNSGNEIQVYKTLQSEPDSVIVGQVGS